MIFVSTPIAGAFVLEVERHEDERGFFARSWCHREGARHGIEVEWVQCNVSFNHRKGTLRGMHWQHPDGEVKLVRATRGALLDVIVDLRPDSPSYRGHFAVELNEENRRALLVPTGCAHGFCTLADATEVFYQMSAYFVPEQARGFRFDDPQFALPWPEGEKIISQRDLELPAYRA